MGEISCIISTGHTKYANYPRRCMIQCKHLFHPCFLLRFSVSMQVEIPQNAYVPRSQPCFFSPVASCPPIVHSFLVPIIAIFLISLIRSVLHPQEDSAMPSCPLSSQANPPSARPVSCAAPSSSRHLAALESATPPFYNHPGISRSVSAPRRFSISGRSDRPKSPSSGRSWS